MSPGLGIASYTRNLGWDGRELLGTWLESDVINTPRFVFEIFFREYEATPDDRFEAVPFLARFALASMMLPNERWIRHDDRLTVEHLALFNFDDFGRRLRAGAFTAFLAHPGESPRERIKTIFQRGGIGAGATLGLVHGRAGVNVLEIVDFAAGLIGLDPAGDDRRRLPGAAIEGG